MTQPIAEILTDLEQALKESTSGKWELSDLEGASFWLEADKATNCTSVLDETTLDFNDNIANDLAFIVAAHAHLPAVLAELRRLQQSENHLLFILRQIVNSLPARLDWLDPNVERMAKEALTPTTPACIHCSYLLGKVYKACDEHQVKETK